jgi:hypothetical protein
MAKFKKKPVVIDAVQLTSSMFIETLEGTMTGSKGDWLITGIKGEKYPCKNEIFLETYEPIKEENWFDIETVVNESELYDIKNGSSTRENIKYNYVTSSINYVNSNTKSDIVNFDQLFNSIIKEEKNE